MERIKPYNAIEADIAFRKFAKSVGNERHCYFALLTASNGGAYELVRKTDVKVR